MCSFSSPCLPGHPSSPPMVDTAHGKILGKYVSLEGFTQPVAVFLGVPFAKPPLGSLRFAPPQPAEPWSFVKNATSYPPIDAERRKMLSDLFTNRKESIPLTFSEDCLYLNIYTPADLTKSSRLPVMVWIHGGSLVAGGASTYDGLALSAHGNVIVVAIQYRLGIWGFFSTGDEHSPGNWGHLDQVAALRWVQDNIVNFGGDPGSVTIFGESAGGESVSVLVLSPLAKNFFHRAISESGVALTPGMVRKDVRPVAEQVAIAAGCKTTTSAVMVNCLRQKTEDELLETTRKLVGMLICVNCPFLPTAIDGVVLPKAPEEILAEKNFNTVPYMVGINKQEFGWLLPLVRKYRHKEKELEGSFLDPFQNVPEDVIPAAIKEYLGGAEDPIKNKDLFVDLIGDVLFAVPSVIVARHHRDAGAPVYMYEFQYHPSFSSDLKPGMVMGDHGDELFSVFGAPFTKGGASGEEINISKMVMKFWGNFAWNGNPNGKTLPAWPEYNQKEGYLKIGATTQAAQGLKDKEVAFWTKVWTKEAAEKPLQEKKTEL
uniref:Carboxylic ester hydrolase n=1 Tax=Peromyscus maniculatus bairdii TaxID=230844 RepID=A0A8C8W7H8_PERMB